MLRYIKEKIDSYQTKTPAQLREENPVLFEIKETYFNIRRSIDDVARHRLTRLSAFDAGRSWIQYELGATLADIFMRVRGDSDGRVKCLEEDIEYFQREAQRSWS